jgi:hypothetical protein
MRKIPNKNIFKKFSGLVTSAGDNPQLSLLVKAREKDILCKSRVLCQVRAHFPQKMEEDS